MSPGFTSPRFIPGWMTRIKLSPAWIGPMNSKGLSLSPCLIHGFQRPGHFAALPDSASQPAAVNSLGDLHLVVLSGDQHAAPYADGNAIAVMSSKRQFVVKLPKNRVDDLVNRGKGQRFNPGHGRIMKEWFVVGKGKANWFELAKEAYNFVK